VGDATAATAGGHKFIASLQSDLRNREDFQAYPVALIDTFAEVVSAVKSSSVA
jgi:hypothetical protein